MIEYSINFIQYSQYNNCFISLIKLPIILIIIILYDRVFVHLLTILISLKIKFDNKIYYKERYEVNSDNVLELYSNWVGEGDDVWRKIWSLSQIDDKSWSDFTEFNGIVCADDFQDEG